MDKYRPKSILGQKFLYDVFKFKRVQIKFVKEKVVWWSVFLERKEGGKRKKGRTCVDLLKWKDLRGVLLCFQ